MWKKRLIWTSAVLANILLNYRPVLSLIGAMNARLGWIGCVFLAYPSRRPLVAPRAGMRALMDQFAWRPAIGGVFRQGRKWGVTFVVASAEPELIDTRNAARLRGLSDQMEEIRRLLQADRCALAGVLPSVLNARGVSGHTSEASVAAECVARAIEEVRVREGLGGDCPLVLLGSRGFVGSRVVSRVTAASDRGEVYQVDRMDGEGAGTELPSELKGRRAMLVNLTWANVLETYVDQMWPGLVVLNEVYPPPSALALRAMRERGVVVYHLAGVEGFALPPFPDAYAGGIPCCAATVGEALGVRVVRLD